MILFKYLKYYLENEIKKIEEEKEMKEIEQQFKDMKIEDKKNSDKMEIEGEKKMKGKKSNKMEIEDEENSDKETRGEIEEVIKPLLKLKKIQKENVKIVYNFKY